MNRGERWTRERPIFRIAHSRPGCGIRMTGECEVLSIPMAPVMTVSLVRNLGERKSSSTLRDDRERLVSLVQVQCAVVAASVSGGRHEDLLASRHGDHVFGYLYITLHHHWIEDLPGTAALWNESQ
jgi:hypothetical protein